MLSLFLPLLAACGAAPQHSASVSEPSTSVPAPTKVFTVPETLPPRAASPRASRHGSTGGTARSTSPGAPTDAEIQRELAAALGVGGSADVIDQAGMTAEGLATVPPSAPSKVSAIISAANQVARAPYRYGGGHGGVGGDEIWTDSAYDCSASVSYALASAGLVQSPLDSTSLMSWGKPGPGKWVTIFANPGHAFMVVAGLRFDTVERARTGTRWGRAYSTVNGFVARHPEGL